MAKSIRRADRRSRWLPKPAELSLEIGVPVPTLGKLILRDGKTGEPMTSR